jgi:hypothetical protein
METQQQQKAQELRYKPDGPYLATRIIEGSNNNLSFFAMFP